MSIQIKDGKLTIDVASVKGDEILLGMLQSARAEMMEDIEDTIKTLNEDREARGCFASFRVTNLQDSYRYMQAMDILIEYYGG